MGGGCSESLRGGFRGQSPLRKFLGSKEHLDWLKIDFNAVEIVTIEEYKQIIQQIPPKKLPQLYLVVQGRVQLEHSSHIIEVDV